MTVWPATRRALTWRQKVHQRRHLRELLALAHWRAEEAAWIIAGVDPWRTKKGEPVQGFNGYIAWGWLPGGHRQEWPDRGEELDDAVREEIDGVACILSGMKGYLNDLWKKPWNWIKYYLSHAQEPPVWMTVAINDRQSILFRQSAKTISDKRREAGRMGGAAKRSKDRDQTDNVKIRLDVWSRDKSRTAYAMAKEAKQMGDTAEDKTIQKWFQKKKLARP